MGRSASQGLHGAPLSPARRRVRTRNGFHWRCRDRKIWVCAGVQRGSATATGRLAARRRIRTGTEINRKIGRHLGGMGRSLREPAPRGGVIVKMNRRQILRTALKSGTGATVFMNFGHFRLFAGSESTYSARAV